MTKLSKIGLRAFLAFAIFISISAMFYIVITNAQEKKEEPLHLRVPVYENTDYLALDENGKASGYAYEYLEEIASINNWKLEYINMPFTEALEALRLGKVDIMPSLYFSEERKKWIEFSKENDGVGGFILCTTENSKYDANEMQNYDGMTIAVIEKSSSVDELIKKINKLQINVNIKYYETGNKAIEAMNNKEVDAALIDKIRYKQAYKILLALDTDESYFAVSKEKSELINSIDSAQQQIFNYNPLFEYELISKYYDIEENVEYSQEEKNFIESSSTIGVGLFIDYKPISYYDSETHRFRGIVVELLDKVSEISGLKFEYSEIAQIGNTDTLYQNTNCLIFAPDVISNSNLTDSDDVVDFGIDSSIVIIKRSEKAINEKDKLKIAIYSSLVDFENEILNIYPNAEFVQYDSLESCLDAVNNNKADMTYENSFVSFIELKNLEYTELEIVSMSYIDTKIIAKVYKSDLLKSILNKTLKKIDTKTKKDIVNEYTISYDYEMTTGEVIRKYHTVIMVATVVIISVFSIMLLLSYKKKQNIEYLNKITKEMNEKNIILNEAMYKAEQASYAKSQFLSQMSHDIRTPMNAITGLTHIAEENINNPDKLEEIFDKIEDSTDYLLQLINDILEMSRIENGKVTLQKNIFDINKMVNAIDSIISIQAKNRGINFAMKIQDTTQYYYGDENKLNQIIMNLLSNSLKFTGKGGTIKLMIEGFRYDGKSVLKIYESDDGCGIDKSFQSKMFEAFESERKNNKTGTGLGLSIVKNYIDLMNGTIEVESEINRGTKYAILVEVEEATQELIDDLKRREKEKEVINEEEFVGVKVLIAEDNTINKEIIENLLQSRGMIVDTAENGEIAVNKFRASALNEYSYILMDIRMPIMDGLEAARKIRTSARSDNDIKIIALSANAFDEDKLESKEAGMNAHLSKPIDYKELIQIMWELGKE